MTRTSFAISLAFLLLICRTSSVFADTPPLYAPQGNLYYYHQDNLSSNSVMTDEAGKIVSNSKYYGYGDERTKTGTKIGERGYTDQIKDGSSNLMYYNARYYNSTLGIFTQPDKEGAIGKYAYANLNPISNNDPSGNDAESGFNQGGGANGICDVMGDPNCEMPQPPPPHPGDLSPCPPGEGLSNCGGINSTGYDSAAFNKIAPPLAKTQKVSIGGGKFIDIPVSGNQIGAINYAANNIYYGMNYSRELGYIENQLSVLNVLLGKTYPGSIDNYEALLAARTMWEKKEIDFSIRQGNATPLQRLKEDLLACYDYPNLLATWIIHNMPDQQVWATGNIGHGFIATEITDSENRNGLAIVDAAWGKNVQSAEEYIKRYPWPAAWADYSYGFNPEFSSGSQSRFVYDMSRALEKTGMISVQHQTGPR